MYRERMQRYLNLVQDQDELGIDIFINGVLYCILVNVI